MRRRVLHAQDDAAQQDRHCLVETVGRELGNAAARRRPAGVVEQAIQATEAVERVRDHGSDVGLDRNVGADEAGVGCEPCRERLAGI